MTRCLALLLALSLSFAPLSASPLPEPPPSSVLLLPEEAAEIEAAIVQAREALAKSNATIATQSRTLTALWILSGALAVALVADAVADLVAAAKK